MIDGKIPGLSLRYQSGNIRKQKKIVSLIKVESKNNKPLLPLLKYVAEHLYEASY